MPYIVNPKGRIVAIDDINAYNEWIAKDNFRPATPQEIKEVEELAIVKMKAQEIAKNKELIKNGIYLVTVSQGGKDGYGIASEKMINELQRLEIPVSLHNQGQKVAILFHNPYSISRLDNDYRIIYTMFESDKIPNDWLEYLELANLILVPSKWCQKVFKKSGVKTEVLPLGYDSRVFKYKEKEKKRKKRKDFVFLHYNAFNIRKGFLEVFKAFNKAFSKDEPVKLVLKTTLERIPLPISKREYPNIEIVQGNKTDLDMVKLNQEADCFVFPSRGEGFGMTPLEAMACGTTAIVPNAHGITEYFNPKYMYEVKVKEKCPAIYARYKGQNVGQMVICDIDDLAKKMRYAYEHEEETHEKGRLASKYVKKWTYEQTAKGLSDIIKDIIEKPIPQRQLQNVLEVEQVS